jgi:hypothetical protein
MTEKKGKKPKAAVEPDESLAVTAAKAIGATAGKIAALVGAQPAKAKKQKLAKKTKSRLPRRQKKANKSGACPADLARSVGQTIGVCGLSFLLGWGLTQTTRNRSLPTGD